MWLVFLATAHAEVKEAAVIQTFKEPLSDAGTCQVIADYANRGEIQKLEASVLSDSRPSNDEVNRIFAGNDISFTAPNYWFVDLNDDGIPDHFVIDDEGTMHVKYGFFLSGKAGAVVISFDDAFDENLDLSLLVVNGKYYVLSSYGVKLGKLWRLSKDGKFQPICKYLQRSKPFIELIEGNKKPICLEASAGHVKYINFSPAKNISFSHQSEVIGFARLDINNDGKPDNIAKIGYDGWCGGRGVHWTQVYVTNDSKTGISDSKVNAILNSSLGGCTVSQSAFIYDGMAYVDEQDEDGSRTILSIKDGKGEIVCRFRGHFLYDFEKVGQETGAKPGYVGLTSEEAKNFWYSFQSAIASGKPSEVAKFVNFPLRVNFIDKGRHRNIKASQFLSSYSTIFTPEVKSALLSQDPTHLLDPAFGKWAGSGGMEREGIVWFTGFCPDSDCKQHKILAASVNVWATKRPPHHSSRSRQSAPIKIQADE